ncbi:Serine/threonine-protein kinase [Tulasnella sp. UAMH 9824]|nr:Serine/threonine-protein kinase [Tulasnella sp. UAMH 9824]
MSDSSRSRQQQLSLTQVRRIQDEEAYPYILTAEIGKGSFATVYKGFHSTTRKAVAIKTVSRSILTHKLLENLESEIAILKALRHKNITELTDIVKARAHIYLVMEFCSGGDLSKYIRHRGRVEGLEYTPYPGAAQQYWPHPKSGGLDPVVVRCFIGQLASAMKFLRDRNLIHRDIKPQNLLLEPSTPADAPVPIGIPILKVADFGFARSLPNATLAETLCGSPLYMAPEILRYEKYDAKADLWSIGAVIYEISVGKPPFRAQNHMELLKKIEHARGRVNFPDEVAAKEAAQLKEKGLPASPRSSSRPEKEITVVPADIKALIRILLKRKPVERASFEQFFANEAVKAQLDLLEPPPPPTPGVWENGKQDPSTDDGTIDNDVAETAPPPKRPESKRKDKSSRTREAIDENAEPLEGTPYDPKLYVPQPSFKFRRTDSEALLESPGLAGPSVLRKKNRMSGSHVPRPSSPRRGRDRRESNAEEPTGEGARSEKEYVIIDPELAESANGAALFATTPSFLEALTWWLWRSGHETEWKRPPTDRRTSVGARSAAAAAAGLTKQAARLVIGATIGTGHAPSSGSSTPKHPPLSPTFSKPIPIAGKRHSSANDVPPFATPTRRSPSPSANFGLEPMTPTVPMTFPPPPNPNPAPSSMPTSGAYGILADGHAPSRSQPSALVRAINLASKKLFGSPTQTPATLAPSSPPGPGLVINGNGHSGGSPQSNGVPTEVDPEKERRSAAAEAENAVLVAVEDIAQKAHVLKEFADQKSAKVENMPSKPLLTPSHFTKKKGEPSRSADARRKLEMEAEHTAVTAIALYLATMSFCQRGINDLNKYCQEHLDGPREADAGEPNSGIDDALVWFRDTFKICVERSEAIKAWLPDGHREVNMFIDRVIYDHALALMRHAASKELLEENFPQVQREYERALWMLYAIADDVIQDGNPYRDQDVATINTFVETTKTRLMRLKRRIESLDQRDDA